MGITPAPFNVWPLAWIALVPLWILIVSPNQNSKFFFSKSFLLFPLLWGIGYHGFALFWITGIHPMTWLGVPWLASLAIAAFCLTFITLWGAALVTIWAICQAWISQKLNLKSPFSPWVRVLIGTAIWCALEAIWSLGNLWWTSLAYTQSPHNLIILHLGQLSGTTAVTAAIVAVNGLIAEAWIYLSDRQEINPKKTLLFLLSPLILFLSLHAVGFILSDRPLIHPPETALKIGIVQGNIPNSIKFGSEGWRRALARYTSGYNALADRGVDAVLIPETALPYLWEENRQFSEFYQAILDKGVVAWVGSFGSQGSNFTNSLFTVTGTGETFSRYDKTKLVPLGEYIPFEEILGKFIDKISPLDAHLVAGTSNQIFDTPFGRAIAGICYDSAFSYHFRRQAAAGGEFILSASNDAHYTSAMMQQHHAQDVMRAIETDRWAIRATNTGYSAIVDPHGKTLWKSRMNAYEIHAATIYRRQTKTLYVRWGDWLLPVLLVGSAIALIVNWKR